MRAARMPHVLTLDQVRSRGVPALPPDEVVHVCENPTIVEVVADRWTAGRRCAGQARPGAGLRLRPAEHGGGRTAGDPHRGGEECRYHGDFDWAGLRIARALHERIPWTPWRYTAADYLAVVEDGPLSRALTGRPAESPWDPELAITMVEHGLAVEEEAVAEVLADDVLTTQK